MQLAHDFFPQGLFKPILCLHRKCSILFVNYLCIKWWIKEIVKMGKSSSDERVEREEEGWKQDEEQKERVVERSENEEKG